MATDKVNPGDLVGGTFDPKTLPGLGAERTTEEVVADIISKDPQAHSLTLEERKRRALAQAAAQAEEDRKFFEDDESGLAE